MPTFWIALLALYVGFYRLGWFPGAERLDPGTNPPPHVTGLYTIDALLAGNSASSGRRSTTSSCRRSCSRRSTSAC